MAEQVTYAEVKFKDHPQGRVSSAKDRGTASLDVPLPAESTLHEYRTLTGQPQQDGHQKAARCSCWVYATVILGILCLLLAILSIVLGIFCLSAGPRLYCPRGWALWNTTCYYKSAEKKDWPSSLEDCISRGAYLVTTYDNKWDLFRETPFWVGAVTRDRKPSWLITKNVLSVDRASYLIHVEINGIWYNCGSRKDSEANSPSVRHCNEQLLWICERAATFHPMDQTS